MRFLGFGIGDRVPDVKTVWLYRETLSQAGKVEDLFRLFDRHLAREGYIARGGQLPDASIVAGAAHPQHTRRKRCDQRW